MRSSRVVRASENQCRSRNCPGFDPSILRHSGIWGAEDEAVLYIVHKKREKNLKNTHLKKKKIIFSSLPQEPELEGSWFSEKGPHPEFSTTQENGTVIQVQLGYDVSISNSALLRAQ